MLLKRRTLPQGSGGCRREAVLWLQGRAVGRVIVCGRDGPWRFGRFAPAGPFDAYAALFAQWARLMHAGGDGPLTDDQRAKLAAIERAVDRLDAWLVDAVGPVGGPAPRRRRIAPLNIDGDIIEWKEQ